MKTKPLAVVLLLALGVVSNAAQATTQQDEQRAAILASASASLYRYALATDENNRAMMEDTFTDDAVLDASVAGGKQVPKLVGKKAIVDFILKGRAEQKDVRRHFISNIWVEKFDNRHATLRSYHLIVVTADGTSHTKSTGTYEDEMVLGADGVWRTAHKVVMLDAPY
jgi:hypothetical protein